MRPGAALVAIAVLVLSGLLVTGPAAAAPAPPADGALVLELTEVGPRLVTAAGPGLLTLTGTLRNTGDVAVDDLQVRAQRGPALTTEGDVRTALAGEALADAVTPDFTALPGRLAPGQERGVRLTVPLQGAPQESLALTEAGVYELLVNVNGVPADGPRARLAAVRMLLPVLSLRGGETPAAPDGTTPVSLLYPISDVPRRLPTVPGEPTLLTDDELAASFAPGGRLAGLVTMLAARAPVGERLREAVCVAVDPDLVETAALMVDGYQVVGPDGGRVPGTGAEAAARWLDDLATATRGGCLLALPYADADLVALTRGGLPEMAQRALTDGRSVLARLLGTPVLPGTTWPAGGVLDEATLLGVTSAEGRSLVLGADSVEGAGTGGVRTVGAGGRSQLALLTDPLLTEAADGPDLLLAGPRPPSSSPAGGTGPLSTQDLIGALTFRSRTADTPPTVVAPPHRWAADATAVGELLDAVDRLVTAGLLTPRAPGPVLVRGPSDRGERAQLDYPVVAGAREVPQDVVATVRVALADIADLASATNTETEVGAEPEDVLEPLRRGTLRAVSAAWRGSPEQARAAADLVRERIDALRGAVRIVEPPGPYSLGSSEAPLLLTVSNGLPVAMRVRVELESPNGLQVAPVGTVEVPALGRRQVEVSARITRSGQFTVLATVRTPDGGILGPPSRLQVRSTAYGDVTLWLTGTAGLLLVVLAVRRILRRVRGEPGPARATAPGSGALPPPPRNAQDGGTAPADPPRSPLGSADGR